MGYAIMTSAMKSRSAGTHSASTSIKQSRTCVSVSKLGRTPCYSWTNLTLR